jgi:peroxiredoxin
MESSSGEKTFSVANQKPEFTPGKEYKPINYKSAILVFLVVISLLVIISLQLKESGIRLWTRATLDVGYAAPDFAFPNLDGKMISLSAHRGKVVLVNIWATWCPPCVDEMPSMEKLYQGFKGNHFEILAVSIDTLGIKAVAPFMKKYKLTFPALIDPEGEIKTLYKATGVPESFIIDKEGILIKKIIGARNWASPEVFRFFRDLIQKPLAQK